MEILIEKAKRLLTLKRDGQPLLECSVALGSQPVGAKAQSGDGKTPEGIFYICLVKTEGKYGRSLGLSYPDAPSAKIAQAHGLIDDGAYAAILEAHRRHTRPPWGTAMGGEIYLHEGGAASDWTAGCIALDSCDMDVVFKHWRDIDQVAILP